MKQHELGANIKAPFKVGDWVESLIKGQEEEK